MTKLGEVRKSWKRRWFKLDGEVNKMMWYYEDEACAKEKGRIDMRKVTLVRTELSVGRSQQDAGRIELVTAQRCGIRFHKNAPWVQTESYLFWLAHRIRILGSSPRVCVHAIG